eukprot:s751_g11.t1
MELSFKGSGAIKSFKLGGIEASLTIGVRLGRIGAATDEDTLESVKICDKSTLFLVKGASSASGGAETKVEKKEEEPVVPTTIVQNAMPRERKRKRSNSELEEETKAKKEKEEEAKEEQGKVDPDSEAMEDDKTKCWFCGKKCGLTGFECKCGYTFCAKCRHAEDNSVFQLSRTDHNCDFDHKGRGREILAKNNPNISIKGGAPAVLDGWWNLNSTRKRPAQVGPFYLAAWLAQLQAEGYTIFLVLGSFPEPTQPSTDDQHGMENFHAVADLLEKAKSSGGNPVMNEPDSDEEGLADFVELSEPILETHSRVSLADACASMREMGFEKPQIDIALQLGAHDGEVASQFLAIMHPVENPEVGTNPEVWAREMQACILGLDMVNASMDIVVQGLLRIGTLLSYPQAGFQI